MKLSKRALRMSLGAAFSAGLVPAWKRFNEAAKNPKATQDALLATLVKRNAYTQYGQEHHFQNIRDIKTWQSNVPIVRYESLTDWIEKIANGQANVLTHQKVRMLERTGGSTNTNKLIPYTEGLLRDFSNATGPWLFDLHRQHPQLLGTSSYWSISPVAQEKEYTQGNLPIGFEDDAEYFGKLQRFAIDHLMAVPNHVARIADMNTWRHETARRLLNTPDLGLISVWSPSFMTLLMEYIEERLDDLLACLPRRRADFLRRSLQREGSVRDRALWPKLRVLSCWADGPSEHLLPQLRRFFPHTLIQPKGLLATEGVISFPYGNEHEGSIVAITSHFFEWIDLEHPNRSPLGTHELREGGNYSPVLSTSGGLYRYHLPDVVRVLSNKSGLPRIRFEEKLDRVSDRFGEKIHAAQVQEGLKHAAHETGISPRFALLSPSTKPDRYRLYLELDQPSNPELFVRTLENHLLRSHHYSYCRRLGQLAPMDVRCIQNGAATYLRVQQMRGQRAGDVKPTCLDPQGGWDDVFPTLQQETVSSYVHSLQ